MKYIYGKLLSQLCQVLGQNSIKSASALRKPKILYRSLKSYDLMIPFRVIFMTYIWSKDEIITCTYIDFTFNPLISHLTHFSLVSHFYNP